MHSANGKPSRKQVSNASFRLDTPAGEAKVASCAVSVCWEFTHVCGDGPQQVNFILNEDNCLNDGTLRVPPQVKGDITQVAASKSARLLPLSLWIGGMLAVILATILLADGQKNLRRLTGMPTASLAIPGPDKRKPAGDAAVAKHPREEAIPSSLLAQPAALPVSLERLGNPQQRCERLAQEGSDLPSYLAYDGYSQCTTLIVGGSGENPPSVFVQIQTDSSGDISSFRLKFNTRGIEAGNLVQQGLTALKQFGGLGATGDELLVALGSRIIRWESFRLVWGNYSLVMDRELADPQRFNLIGRPRNQIRATRQFRE